MPLPVSHALAGVAVFAETDRGSRRGGWWRLLAAVFLANAPDLDLVPGMLLGDPNRFHHGVSHSLAAGAVVGLGVALVLGSRKAWWPLRGGRRSLLSTAAIVFTLWGSHVVLDALTHDPSPPVGVPMFWPLSDQRVSLGPVFPRADKLAGPTSSGDFLASILSAHNARAAGIELLLVGPFAAWAGWRRSRRQLRTRLSS